MAGNDWLSQDLAEAPVSALSRLSFGGALYSDHRRNDTKRALVIDALFLVILILVWATSSRGSASPASSQSQRQEQSQSQSQSSRQSSSSPQSQSQAQPSSSTQDKDAAKEKSAADKATTEKPKKKKVFTEDDLSSLKGGVSVVGDGNARGDSAMSRASDSGSGSARSSDEKSWRERAAQIHQQIDSTDEQIKALKEDIKKNGGSGFDAQSGLQQNRVYLVDKNARVDNLEKKKKALEQKLDDLQDEARKAGVPSDWVR